jgi:hypothetical protein
MINNINSIKYLILLLIFLVFYCLYQINSLKKTREEFDATTDAAITNAVKKIYLADVEAIRLLSNFAIQLSQGGTTIPGNVTISGNSIVNGTSKVNGDHTIGGKLIVNGTHINTLNGNTFYCGGRQHVHGEELLYILNKNGVLISKEWGGNGNLTVQGDIYSNGVITCKAINITG